MSVVYLGQFTVAASVPGIDAEIIALKVATDKLAATVNTELASIAQAANDINVQLGALGAAKIAIRIPATADFQAQLDAATSISAGLSAQVSNPAGYISELLLGVAEVQANVNALVPSVALSAQISAAVGTESVMSGKILAVDLQLAALDTIGNALGVVVAAVLAIQQALASAVSAANNVLVAIASYLSGLDGATGAHCLLYDGALSGLGAAIDLATPSTGIGGATSVHVPLVLTPSSNVATVSAMDQVFRVST